MQLISSPNGILTPTIQTINKFIANIIIIIIIDSRHRNSLPNYNSKIYMYSDVVRSAVAVVHVVFLQVPVSHPRVFASR